MKADQSLMTFLVLMPLLLPSPPVFLDFFFEFMSVTSKLMELKAKLLMFNLGTSPLTFTSRYTPGLFLIFCEPRHLFFEAQDKSSLFSHLKFKKIIIYV